VSGNLFEFPAGWYIYINVRSTLSFLVLACLGVGLVPARAAHTQVSLVLRDSVARPGDTVMAGVHLHMDPEWHTYWKNSGASGIPTSVKWDLPAGISAGAIQWPAPVKLPPDDLTTYIYENDVVLIVPLKLAADMAPGPHPLKASVSWLECKEQCVPGHADATATLNVGPETKPSPDAGLIQTWQKKLPQSGHGLSAVAWWGKPVKDDLRPLLLEWSWPTAVSEPDFYPAGSEQFEVQGATRRLPADAGKVLLTKLVKKFEGDWPRQISGLVVQKSDGQESAFTVELPIQSAGPSMATVSATTAESTSPEAAPPAATVLAQPLWRMLLYAFLGGLILNVMPCVLPVIALKILGFVGEARDNPRHVRILGLIYAAGVLVSFLALAALVVGVKAAGHKAGWGMQFSSPEFVVLLIVLVTLVSLNLFGLFEINLGSRTLGAAGALASRQGPAGAFFNGVLATVLATPCTAPFLGVALGFAFAQSAPWIVLFFSTVGVGLASPYVILSWQPAWLKWLPKPGAWMEKFKIVMGFPMLATAVWLFGLLPAYYGRRSWWLGLFLVVVALAAWIYGEFVQRGRARRGLAIAVMLALLAGGFAYLVEGQLDWREPVAAQVAARSATKTGQGIDWEPWSARAVAHAQEEGHPALVDFTADWCLTCQANKRLALDVPAVRARLKDIGAATFLGDYTRFPDDITAELNRYGRAGVPLVLVYPAGAGKPPIVLPELLTPGIVMDALNRVAQ
jgi:thiol:disulfide interchange protein/DsbC/DsbD-like thiol-disulfide interchange protein